MATGMILEPELAMQVLGVVLTGLLLGYACKALRDLRLGKERAAATAALAGLTVGVVLGPLSALWA